MDAYVHIAAGAMIGVLTKQTASVVFADLEEDCGTSLSCKFAHGLELASMYGAACTVGLFSHIFLDMLPHGDYVARYGMILKDVYWLWREVLAALLVLGLIAVLLRGRSRLAALTAGVAAALLDLDNLAIGLGWIERSQALSPSHSGVWPHGQDLGMISFVVEIGVFIGALLLLTGVGLYERRVKLSRRAAVQGASM